MCIYLLFPRLRAETATKATLNMYSMLTCAGSCFTMFKSMRYVLFEDVLISIL